MLVSAAFSSANERSPLVVCSSLTRLETVTSSVIAPTSMFRAGIVMRSLALTTRLVCSKVLKPWSAASSV
jgi:hypothetical protein